MRKVLMIGGGVIVIILGVVLLPLPGPGILVVALGFGMMASEVPKVQEWMKKMRDKLPVSEETKKKIPIPGEGKDQKLKSA